ncbi:MAG TPA: hypothetical protein VLA77_02570 [Candidatus Saccharimonadales bacterium]|nr:hypothetical protein [Candidatus Saccharimonadales bacterium]
MNVAPKWPALGLAVAAVVVLATGCTPNVTPSTAKPTASASVNGGGSGGEVPPSDMKLGGNNVSAVEVLEVAKTYLDLKFEIRFMNLNDTQTCVNGTVVTTITGDMPFLGECITENDKTLYLVTTRTELDTIKLPGSVIWFQLVLQAGMIKWEFAPAANCAAAWITVKEAAKLAELTDDLKRYQKLTPESIKAINRGAAMAAHTTRPVGDCAKPQ